MDRNIPNVRFVSGIASNSERMVVIDLWWEALALLLICIKPQRSCTSPFSVAGVEGGTDAEASRMALTNWESLTIPQDLENFDFG